MDLGATLSRLYRELGDCHMSTDTLWKLLLVFWVLPLFNSLALNVPLKSHMEWLKVPNSCYHCS